MVTIPDNIPEIPEVLGFQESAYKGLESMSEPGKLREWYVGRSDCDTRINMIEAEGGDVDGLDELGEADSSLILFPAAC